MKIKFLLILFILILTGCNKNQVEDPVVDPETNNCIQIGLSFDSFVIERWQRDRDLFVSTATELGAQVNVQNANGSLDEQIDQIEYFIEINMDVIVVIAVETDGILDIIKKAKSAGIKVIAYDRLIKNANVDLYISFDNEEVGRLMAKSLVENVEPYGKISIIFGPTTDNNVSLVEKGFNEVISKSTLIVVYKDYADGWLAERAFTAVNETLKITDLFNGMLCGNDNLAGQAIKALSEQRIAGEIYVVGQDADLDACQRIVEGTQTMTVYKPVDVLAKKAAEYAVLLGKNETITTDYIFYDGSVDIPYVKLIPIAVTKENIDKIIIDGGFHLKEEVYLNMPSN
jgi:D-xylose transport system substrate-binding protein